MIVLPDASLQYRPDIGAIVVRWSGESSNSALTAVYNELLQRAKDNKCYRWLLDSRRRNQLDKDNINWLETVFLPSICPELKSNVRMAYLVSPVRMEAIQQMPQRNRTIYHEDYSCQIEVFDYEEAAYQWLGVTR